MKLKSGASMHDQSIVIYFALINLNIMKMIFAALFMTVFLLDPNVQNVPNGYAKVRWSDAGVRCQLYYKMVLLILDSHYATVKCDGGVSLFFGLRVAS